MKYLVTLDQGHEEIPLVLARDLWKAEQRKKDYEIGWSGHIGPIKIYKITLEKI